MARVLIIDDSPDDREQFSNLLEDSEPDVTVVSCAGGQDGLAALAGQAFDCVLLDLRLDGEDGLEVLASLHRVRPHLPVIVFTGQGSEKAAVDAFVSGAAYYLPKQGLTTKSLWTAVTRVMQQAAKDRELKSKNEALERSNRLDAVGQLAAGIAHDFNNQLGALRYCIDLIDNPSATSKQSERVRIAHSIIDDSASLASRLLSLSRQGDLLARNVALTGVFADLTTLASASVSDLVMLEIETPENNLSAFCDPSQFLNALLNLILNADDAIVAGGSPGSIVVTSERTGGTLRIVVTDNGTGMRDDVCVKCIDPFFTTKAETNGTGLGLAMVQSFVNETGGELLIQSNEGVGTGVTMVLPVGGQDEAEPGKPKIVVTPTNTGVISVLVVEDQFLLAMMTKEVLEKDGFSVETAGDGEQALELLSTGLEPDVIITDIKMPGMNGFELVKELQRQHSDAGVIYVTGYSDATEHKNQKLYGPVLKKPVDAEKLIATIHDVLRNE